MGDPHACATRGWHWERGALPSLPTEPLIWITGIRCQFPQPGSRLLGLPGPRRPFALPEVNTPRSGRAVAWRPRGPAEPLGAAVPPGPAGAALHARPCAARRRRKLCAKGGRGAAIAARGSPGTRPSFLLSLLPFPSLPLSAPGPGPAVTVTAPSPAPPPAHPPVGSRDPRSADAAAAPGTRGGRRRGDAAPQGLPGRADCRVCGAAGSRPVPPALWRGRWRGWPGQGVPQGPGHS